MTDSVRLSRIVAAAALAVALLAAASSNVAAPTSRPGEAPVAAPSTDAVAAPGTEPQSGDGTPATGPRHAGPASPGAASTVPSLAAMAARLAGEAMEAADVPGLVLVVVRDGAVVLAEGYGWARLEPRRPVDPAATVFRVGSVSKSLTASAVLALAEQGRLPLDADVAELLQATPAERVAAPLREDWQAMRRHVPGALVSGVTPLHLLTHTAGLDERLFGGHARSPGEWTTLAGWFARHPPRHFDEPGRVIAYNDQGTTLAGLAVEAVTGDTFADWTRRELFDPLGMQHTSFRQVDLPAAMRGDLAVAYTRLGGAGAPLTPYPADFVVPTPAAGLYTTGADMGRYLLALLAPAEHAAGALTPRVVRRQLSPAAAHHLEMSGRAFGFAESHRDGWRVLHKDGQASGFNARLTLVPEAGIGVFSAANRSIFDRAWGFNPAARLHRELAASLLGELLPADGPGGSAASAGRTAAGEAGAAPGEPAAEAEPDLLVVGPDGYGAPLLPGTYRDVVAARHGVEKILSLGNQVTVGDAGDGRVEVFGLTLEPLEAGGPGLYGPVEGGDGRVAGGPDASGEPRYLFVGAGGFERIPWVDTPAALVAGAGLAVTVGLVSLLVWAWRGRRAADARLRRASAALALAGGCLAAFVALFAAAFLRIDPQSWFHGVPPLVVASLALPVVAAVAAVATAAWTVAAWRAGAGGPATRFGLGMGVAATAAVLALLWRWNLLGWWL